jgi:hypothetical protein
MGFPKIGNIIFSQSFISGQATICNLEGMKEEGKNENTRGISSAFAFFQL